MFNFKIPRLTTVATILAAGLAQSCYYDNAVDLYHASSLDCTKVSAKFASDVLPIIIQYCSGPSAPCHSTANNLGGTVLETWTDISAKKDRIIVRTVQLKTMPQSGPLSTTDLNIIQCWVNGGALNN